jgi:hypothetical protein
VAASTMPGVLPGGGDAVLRGGLDPPPPAESGTEDERWRVCRISLAALDAGVAAPRICAPTDVHWTCLYPPALKLPCAGQSTLVHAVEGGRPRFPGAVGGAGGGGRGAGAEAGCGNATTATTTGVAGPASGTAGARAKNGATTGVLPADGDAVGGSPESGRSSSSDDP